MVPPGFAIWLSPMAKGYQPPARRIKERSREIDSQLRTVIASSAPAAQAA